MNALLNSGPANTKMYPVINATNVDRTGTQVVNK